MSRPLRNALFAATFATAMMAAPAGLAQVRSPPCGAGQYGILANSANGTLDIQASASGPNEIGGQVFGDRISGYSSAAGRHFVFVRWVGQTPTQAYVGRCNLGVITGVFYALNAAQGGAAPQRNAFAFRAARPNAIVGAQPPANPQNSPNPQSDPKGAWWALANTTNSPLVVEIGANGAVSGWIFGERIIGHYSSEAGTIAFLRLRGAGPIQFYQGKSVRVDPVNKIYRFEGEFHALNEPNGGASQASNTFAFNAVNQTAFVRYRPDQTAFCLEIENGSTANRARLRQAACSGAAQQDMTLLRMGAQGATTMVLRHSGRCLDIPNADTASGVFVQQSFCHGGANQQIRLQGLNAGANAQLTFQHSNLCLTMAGAAAGDEARQENCNPVQARNLFVVQ